MSARAQWEKVQLALGTTPDRIPGPNDRAAFERLFAQAQQEYRSGAAAAPAPLGALTSWLLQFAGQEVGLRELSRNQAPGIAKYWEATSYPEGMANREPYCAAFLCWIVREAVRATGTIPAWRLPKSARAFDWDEHWAPHNQLTLTRWPKASQLAPGDLAVFSFSHIGLVTGLSGGEVLTIEANTNAEGSREGDGVHRKRRDPSLIRSAIRLA